MDLMDFRAHDGSRQFAAIPESVSWAALRDHIAALPGAQITGYLTDEVTEAWIDFSYRGYAMTVNNQFGEFWFFVDDPNCPESVLTDVVGHCTQLRERSK